MIYLNCVYLWSILYVSVKLSGDTQFIFSSGANYQRRVTAALTALTAPPTAIPTGLGCSLFLFQTFNENTKRTFLFKINLKFHVSLVGDRIFFSFNTLYRS